MSDSKIIIENRGTSPVVVTGGVVPEGVYADWRVREVRKATDERGYHVHVDGYCKRADGLPRCESGK